MGRPERTADGNFVRHVLNRAMTFFERNDDCAAFLGVQEQSVDRKNTCLLTDCVMPSRRHVVAWPPEDTSSQRKGVLEID